MELRHIRYFVAVAEQRSFSRAAEQLRLAQPPLSQQIRKLEKEIGVELFVRTTRSVSLTHAGEVFYERVRPMLRDGDAAIQAAQRAARGELGVLSVGFTGSATYALLPALTRAHRDRFPGVSLEPRGEMLTSAQVDGLQRGQIQVGLLRPPVTSADLVVEVVRREPLVALLPVRHPLAGDRQVRLSALRDEPFLSYPSSPVSSVQGVALEACRAAGFVPEVLQEVAETATMVALVAGGLGVSLVPASTQQLHIGGAVYRPLADPVPEVALALAYRAGPVSPLVRRFLETARSVIRSRDRTAPTASPAPREPVDAGFDEDGLLGNMA